MWFRAENNIDTLIAKGKLDKATALLKEKLELEPNNTTMRQQLGDVLGRAGKTEQAQAAQFNNTKIEAAFLRAVAHYQTPQWDGPMTLLRPVLDRKYKVSGGNWVSAEREYVFADNDWTRYAPQVQVIEVPGDHDSLVLSPNVVVMAAELREVIRDALADGRPRQATAAE